MNTVDTPSPAAGSVTSSSATERSTRKLFVVSRILLGLVFVVFGLNGFLQFIPIPPPTAKAGAFLGALAATGYMFPLVKGLEIVAGAMLLANRFVPLALLILAPIVVNIVTLQLFLNPTELPMPLVLTVLGLITAWSRREAFKPVLAP